MDAAGPNTPRDAAPAPLDGGPREPPPNHFVEVLGVTPEEVDQRIEAAFQQLFHGDPSSQAIYFEVGDDAAYIYDRAHEDTRMDAIGYGLFIAVELDHQEEFDRVWSFAKRNMQFTMGSHAGYFSLRCTVAGEDCSTESAVLGTFFSATALLFAEARWGNGEGILDYGTQAREILDLMRNIEARNRGVLDGVTNAFNAETSLPQKEPTSEERDFVMPGVVWPAFFEIWAEKTGNPFWETVAEQSRAYLNVASHPETGLYPHTTNADGAVPEGFVTTDANTRSFATFDQDTYGVALSLALDQTWFGVDPAQVDVANRIITFFDAYGGSYPAIYLYTGEQQNSNASGALVAMNGAIAGISTRAAREAFIRVVWDTPTPIGFYRYFDGVSQLLSLMYLGGVLRPY
jgi:oligosaccharide reducing-end xylanase